MVTIANPISSTYYNPRPFSIRVGVGEFFNECGYSLSLPLWKTSELFGHSFTPIRPGKFDNCDNYFLELIKRITLCTLGIFTLPLFLPLWILGGGIDIAGDLIKGIKYTYWKGERGEILSHSSEYTFFSLNACMLWGALPIFFGGVSPASQRGSKVGALIQTHDPDFVLLQEVSLEGAKALYKELKGEYAHFYTRISPNPPTNLDTSLFVASKYPIVSEPVLIELPTHGSIKRSIFAFETPDLWVITTHFEAGNTPADQEIRKRQVDLLATTVDTLKAKSNKPWIIGCDSNIQRTGAPDDEYSRSEIEHHFYNVHKNINPEVTERTATCTNLLTVRRRGIQCTEAQNEHIDFFLTEKRAGAQRASSYLVNTYDSMDDEALSDHRALLSTYRLL